MSCRRQNDDKNDEDAFNGAAQTCKANSLLIRLHRLVESEVRNKGEDKKKSKWKYHFVFFYYKLFVPSHLLQYQL